MGLNNLSAADKPSITFNQLKSKYGASEKQNYAAYRNELNFNFEDLKEEVDQEYFNVPEENGEDPPLRLRGK